MKHRIRKLTSLLLSLSLISALTLPAAASNALGEDLSAKDTLLHQETQLSTKSRCVFCDVISMGERHAKRSVR